MSGRAQLFEPVGIPLSKLTAQLFEPVGIPLHAPSGEIGSAQATPKVKTRASAENRETRRRIGTSRLEM